MLFLNQVFLNILELKEKYFIVSVLFTLKSSLNAVIGMQIAYLGFVILIN